MSARDCSRRLKITERGSYVRDGRAPIPARASTSRVMSANRGKGTGPEIALRRILRAYGIRGFRSNPPEIVGRPDIVIPQSRVAIFVHGCFWHRCPHCGPSFPKTHRAFWTSKFRANGLRDARKANSLRHSGWKVRTVWECQIRDSPIDVAKRIIAAIEGEIRNLHATRPRRRILSIPGAASARSKASRSLVGLPPRMTASATNAVATS